MEATTADQISLTVRLEEQESDFTDEFKDLLLSLPKERGWRTNCLHHYLGCWFHARELQGILSARKHFKAQDSDIIVTSLPRTGTIWLKASAYAIVSRQHLTGIHCQNLISSDPHALVPIFEYKVYGNNQLPDLSDLPSPRLFATHVPYSLLPESIKSSKCRVVYICRNPGDNFVSFWQMQVKLRPEALGPLLLEDAFDMYCKGVMAYGPYWEHVLGYWKQSLENPERVMFMMYEDMKENIIPQLKRLADFLGLPFSWEEEKAGVIEEISKICSFDNLKEFKASVTNNKSIERVAYLRKGKVGDWINHLTPSMVKQLSRITEEKLSGTGLSFKFNLQDKSG